MSAVIFYSWTARLLTAACAAALLVATHLPGDSYPVQAVGAWRIGDKPIHLGAYAFLSIMVFGASGLGRTWPTTAAWLGGLLLFAAVDEATQPWFGRYGDFHDWLADSTGVIAGWGLVQVGRVALGRQHPGRS